MLNINSSLCFGKNSHYAGRFYCVRILRCFSGERLSYHCFYASFFDQTVEREDDADGVFPPSQYLYQRFPHYVPGSLGFPAISLASS